MTNGQNIGKGNNDNLHVYRVRREKRRLFLRVIMPLCVLALLLVLGLLLLIFGFRIQERDVVGSRRYTRDAILQECGIEKGDNLLTASEKEVEARLKNAFPYIKEVVLKKDFPSSFVLEITEEYTTFYYEVEDDYFLFNYELRLMDKFDSREALMATREAIFVEMPLPKSSIVPQYISFFEDDAYVRAFFETLSSSKILSYVNTLDLKDKYTLRLVLCENVTVELGDNTRLDEKFSALYRLIEEKGEKMSGRVDMSDYPRCFYDLKAE